MKTEVRGDRLVEGPAPRTLGRAREIRDQWPSAYQHSQPHPLDLELSPYQRPIHRSAGKPEEVSDFADGQEIRQRLKLQLIASRPTRLHVQEYAGGWSTCLDVWLS